MNCPVCKTYELAPRDLETNLAAQACPNCQGCWVSGKSYWAWIDVHGENLPERLPNGDELAVQERPVVKLCPDCGHILMTYRVGHELTFSLDHCSSCFGIWFDKDEWQILRGRNLHDDVHYLFSEAYQAGIVKAEHVAARRRILTERFGEHDLAEIVRIKRWITGHPKRHELLAYLLNEQ
jgi:Zn-finger nucleic acid-binding protein